jgi:ParB family transcriptional regulator, chromosome partitioning protein
MSNEKKSSHSSLYNEIPVELIEDNPEQPRKFMAEESFASLQKSINEKGVIQPILVQKQDEKIILVSGQRRLLASKNLKKETIPAIFVSGDAKEIALIENLQREDLHVIDEANALESFRKYKTNLDSNFNQEKLASLVGKKQNTVSEFLKISELPKDIKAECIRDKKNNQWTKKILLSIARKKTDAKKKEAFEKAKERLESINKQEKGKGNKDDIFHNALIKRVDTIRNSFNKIETKNLNPNRKTSLKKSLQTLKKELDSLLEKL